MFAIRGVPMDTSVDMDLHENVPLAPYTNFKIGGPARYFVRATSEDDIREALAWAKEHRVEYVILGGGTNVLVSDHGYSGLVIVIAMEQLRLDGSRAHVGAGVSIERLLNATVARGLAGLEWAGGLPGQVGGAIRGNAGAFGGEIKDNVVSVRAMTPAGGLRDFSHEECRFSYRSSVFKEEPGYVVVSAEMEFTQGDPPALRAIADEHIQWRTAKHPIELGNSGSIFKRTPVSEVPPEIFQKYPHIQNAIRDHQIATAFFIDECGLKKKRVGGAEVSEKHPNFIVNATGHATAEDVIMLSNIVKSCVLRTFNIYLEEEVQHIGF